MAKRPEDEEAEGPEPTEEEMEELAEDLPDPDEDE